MDFIKLDIKGIITNKCEEIIYYLKNTMNEYIISMTMLQDNSVHISSRDNIGAASHWKMNDAL